MKLLPSLQTVRQVKAFKKFLINEGIHLQEPCDCGSQVRHNNGGNYHSIVKFAMESGKCFRSGNTFTGDYSPDDEWEECSFSAAIDEIAKLSAEGW